MTDLLNPDNGGGQRESQRERQPPEFPGRRSFLIVWMEVGAAVVGALLSVPLIVYTADPLLRKTTSTSWADLGPVSQFDSLTEPAEPVVSFQRIDGWRLVMLQKPVYVLPPGVSPHRVLSPVCPHLGCAVEWRKATKDFFCPCHNSIFAEDGSVRSGPSPRGMDYLDSMVRDGHLFVQYANFRMLVPSRQVVG